LAWHHKNRRAEKVAIPLFDVDGTQLWPEMMARLEGVKRTGEFVRISRYELSEFNSKHC
jgi:hypothetical protein